MAIYHLRASVISRSAGRSATGAAAYRAGERITDRRTGLSFDYAAKRGVDHTEILAPDSAPEWVFDRSELWNRVEEAETRKNSRTAREIRVALPAELDHGQHVDLVRGFVQAQFVDRGMVADIALHAPGRDGDDRNHHAHILLTTREVDASGFTTKNRDWNKVELLESWRDAWARGSNAALELAGSIERIDHRTLEAQHGEALELAEAARERGDRGAELEQTVRAMSLDRKPLPQLSPGAWQMKERGIDVVAVRAWREIKEQAGIVAREVRELAGHVRSWLDRAVARDGPGLAYAGGGEVERAPEGLAGQMRAAWEARQRGGVDGADREEVGRDLGGDGAGERSLASDDQNAAQDLAARLRQAATGIDQDKAAERARALQQDRQADEQHRAQIEQKRAKELEREAIEKQRAITRDRGPEYGL